MKTKFQTEVSLSLTGVLEMHADLHPAGLPHQLLEVIGSFNDKFTLEGEARGNHPL